MKDNLVEKAMAQVTAAIEQVIAQGGVVHEDNLWDVAEMALDGATKESMVERLKKARTEAYVPSGGWTRGRRK